MTLEQFKKELNLELQGKYPPTEINSFFNIFLADVFMVNKIDYLLDPQQEIPNFNTNQLNNLIQQLNKYVPIQHIVGFTEFMGYQFKVNSHVLIPRPETELLIEWIAKDYPNKSTNILDIGTGSGCIPISLYKKNPQANISSIDISKEALQIATFNAEKNLAKVNFIYQDILKSEQLEQCYDVIVSNPPYVREQEKALMHPNVLNHEPHLALFVSNHNPLLFYEKIAQLAIQHLNPNGALYFEINQYLSTETCLLLKQIGFSNVILKNDQFNNPRMIKATL